MNSVQTKTVANLELISRKYVYFRKNLSWYTARSFCRNSVNIEGHPRGNLAYIKTKADLVALKEAVQNVSGFSGFDLATVTCLYVDSGTISSSMDRNVLQKLEISFYRWV